VNPPTDLPGQDCREWDSLPACQSQGAGWKPVPPCGDIPVQGFEARSEHRGILSRSLILGVGNLLMGDEGVGVAAIRHLETHGFAEHAELVDGGTSGFHLLDLFRDQQHLILIDAATDDHPPGTVSLIQPRYANDFPPTLTAHDIGLKDLIESAALMGYWPRVDLITVSIGDLGEMTMQLSPAVAAALPVIETMVKKRLAEQKEMPETDDSAVTT